MSPIHSLCTRSRPDRSGTCQSHSLHRYSCQWLFDTYPVGMACSRPPLGCFGNILRCMIRMCTPCPNSSNVQFHIPGIPSALDSDHTARTRNPCRTSGLGFPGIGQCNTGCTGSAQQCPCTTLWDTRCTRSSLSCSAQSQQHTPYRLIYPGCSGTTPCCSWYIHSNHPRSRTSRLDTQDTSSGLSALAPSPRCKSHTLSSQSQSAYTPSDTLHTRWPRYSQRHTCPPRT